MADKVRSDDTEADVRVEWTWPRTVDAATNAPERPTDGRELEAEAGDSVSGDGRESAQEEVASMLTVQIESPD